MKQIKLSDSHYIVVDETQEIKDGDWYLSWMSGRILQRKYLNRCNDDVDKKITHSTQPIKGVGYYPLSLAKEIAGEVDVKNKAEMFIDHKLKKGFELERVVCMTNGFVLGYNQCLEDNKDKKYTEEEFLGFHKFYLCSNTNSLYDALKLYIKTLQPPTEVEVEIVEGKLKRK